MCAPSSAGFTTATRVDRERLERVVQALLERLESTCGRDRVVAEAQAEHARAVFAPAACEPSSSSFEIPGLWRPANTGSGIDGWLTTGCAHSVARNGRGERESSREAHADDADPSPRWCARRGRRRAALRNVVTGRFLLKANAWNSELTQSATPIANVSPGVGRSPGVPKNDGITTVKPFVDQVVREPEHLGRDPRRTRGARSPPARHRSRGTGAAAGRGDGGDSPSSPSGLRSVHPWPSLRPSLGSSRGPAYGARSAHRKVSGRPVRPRAAARRRRTPTPPSTWRAPGDRPRIRA